MAHTSYLNLRKEVNIFNPFKKKEKQTGVHFPLDSRRWFYFVVPMPLTKSGFGPAEIGRDADLIRYEVWDQFCNSYGQYEYIPDAVNEAIKLNLTKCVYDEKTGFLYDPELCELDPSQPEDNEDGTA